MEQALHCNFLATNNEAEYEALVAGMKVAQSLKIHELHIKCDSQLVMNQVLGVYQAKDDRMKAYLELVQELKESLLNVGFEQIPRRENGRTKAIASYGYVVNDQGTRYILHYHIEKSAIDKGVTLEILPADDMESWIKPILDYIQHRTLPHDKVRARKICLTAAKITIINGVLYHKSISRP